MKIKEIKKKFEKAKSLMKEHAGLDALLKHMIKVKEEHPEQSDDFTIDERYFQNVTKRIKAIESELSNLFKQLEVK